MAYISFEDLTPEITRSPSFVRRGVIKFLSLSLVASLALNFTDLKPRNEEVKSLRLGPARLEEPDLTPLEIDEWARKRALKSVYGQEKPHKPPKPITKAIGTMAIGKYQDPDGNEWYAFIRSPALLEHSDGDQRAIGAPVADGRIPVLAGHMLCGPTPEPVIEEGPLGHSHTGGFDDTRIGTLQTSTIRPEGCDYEHKVRPIP